MRMWFVVTGALMISGDFVHGRRVESLEGMVSME